MEQCFHYFRSVTLHRCASVVYWTLIRALRTALCPIECYDDTSFYSVGNGAYNDIELHTPLTKYLIVFNLPHYYSLLIKDTSAYCTTTPILNCLHTYTTCTAVYYIRYLHILLNTTK